MAVINFPLQIDFKPAVDAGVAGAARSLSSAFSALEHLALAGDALDHIANRPGSIIARGDAGSFDLCCDADDLIRCEFVDSAASGASPFKLVHVLPSDRYLDFVSALTGDWHADIVRFVHGWPILSVVPSTTTVADGGRGENASPVGGR